MESLPLDQVIHGNCIDLLLQLPAESIDLVFADPPYNLQLKQDLYRPNQTRVAGVEESWEQFDGVESYDRFTYSWLSACRRVLKPTGALWVIGTYHNIFRVGAILQDLGFWILNTVQWIKDNPMPNFRGVRFTNSHETLIWAQVERGAKYTFNHHAMKATNDGLQMRSDWYLPICTGKERLRVDGVKAHPTQKPVALLYRVIQSSSNPGDIILDPFFGTGTTGVAARRLHRHWIGIEADPDYVAIARQRVAAEPVTSYDPGVFVTPDPRKQPRIPFGMLLELGLLKPGDLLSFGRNDPRKATILADGAIEFEGNRGSIHQVARKITGAPGNGWKLWYYLDQATGELQPVDCLRQVARVLLEARE